MLPNNLRLFESLTTVKLPWPTSQPGYMPFKIWMGFQTLVNLQGQAPDTPTLLKAFLPQEAGSNTKNKNKKKTDQQKHGGKMVHA